MMFMSQFKGFQHFILANLCAEIARLIGRELGTFGDQRFGFKRLKLDAVGLGSDGGDTKAQAISRSPL